MLELLCWRANKKGSFRRVEEKSVHRSIDGFKTFANDPR
jgi:hypothetical protein